MALRPHFENNSRHRMDVNWHYLSKEKNDSDGQLLLQGFQKLQNDTSHSSYQRR
jgi:hypothetical protein